MVLFFMVLSTGKQIITECVQLISLKSIKKSTICRKVSCYILTIQKMTGYCLFGRAKGFFKQVPDSSLALISEVTSTCSHKTGPGNYWRVLYPLALLP